MSVCLFVLGRDRIKEGPGVYTDKEPERMGGVPKAFVEVTC
jgi:hypothetical protein